MSRIFIVLFFVITAPYNNVIKASDSDDSLDKLAAMGMDALPTTTTHPTQDTPRRTGLRGLVSRLLGRSQTVGQPAQATQHQLTTHRGSVEILPLATVDGAAETGQGNTPDGETAAGDQIGEDGEDCPARTAEARDGAGGTLTVFAAPASAVAPATVPSHDMLTPAPLPGTLPAIIPPQESLAQLQARLAALYPPPEAPQAADTTSILDYGDRSKVLAKIRSYAYKTGVLSYWLNLLMPYDLPYMMPDELCLLPDLQKLGITKTLISAYSPFVGCLQNLETLESSSYYYGRFLPESICFLAKLESLQISYDCEGSPATDFGIQALPPAFGMLGSLKTLIIRYARLAGLPQSFCHLGRLEHLNLFHNKITQLPENFGALQNLKTINLSHNPLTQLPDTFGHLHALEALDLRSCSLTELPRGFVALQQLRELLLPRNPLTRLPSHIGQMSNLTVLQLNDCQISAIPQSLRGLIHLTTLILSRNPLRTVSGEVFPVNLTRLELNQTQLSEFPDLSRLTQPKFILYINCNNIREIPEGFLPPHLFSLNIGQNPIIKLPESICDIITLRILVVYGTQIGRLPSRFCQWMLMAREPDSDYDRPYKYDKYLRMFMPQPLVALPSGGIFGPLPKFLPDFTFAKDLDEASFRLSFAIPQQPPRIL